MIEVNLKMQSLFFLMHTMGSLLDLSSNYWVWSWSVSHRRVAFFTWPRE